MGTIDRLGLALTTEGFGDRLQYDEPLKAFTSYRVGGPADLLVRVSTLDELRVCLGKARALQVPTLVIGRGTNILVSDAGVRGFVIVNACASYTLEPTGMLLAESGALLRDVALWTAARGWAGVEWAEGIPGTLGGGIVGNAGAYGGCMADVVRWIRALRPDGTEVEIDASDLDYRYRSSALKGQDGADRTIVLQAGLQLMPEDAQVLAKRVTQIARQRRLRTPTGASAGSVFKRTLQYPAGFLVEQAGLKGCRIGEAEVSPKHANFLINTGHASARDIRALMEKVQRDVWAAFAQRLEPEIELVGDWSSWATEETDMRLAGFVGLGREM